MLLLVSSFKFYNATWPYVQNYCIQTSQPVQIDFQLQYVYSIYFLHHNRTAENLSLLQATFKHSPYSHEDNDN